MDEEVCLDSDFIIELVNKKEKLNELFDKYYHLDTHTTTINIFELLQRIENVEIIENFISKIKILDFDEKSARLASKMHKELKSRGQLLDFRDLFIASISISNNCTLATLNKKHFSRIKGLKLLKI
ncbi:MAG: type II toxin-antitoxin system VapC family toxin [Nanoarchaeota archaeon]